MAVEGRCRGGSGGSSGFRWRRVRVIDIVGVDGGGGRVDGRNEIGCIGTRGCSGLCVGY